MELDTKQVETWLIISERGVEQERLKKKNFK